MTTRTRTSNGKVPHKQLPPPVPTEMAPPEPTGTIEERVANLEQQMTRLATGLAALLAQQMQPQMQQAILGQLTGASEAPAPA